MAYMYTPLADLRAERCSNFMKTCSTIITEIVDLDHIYGAKTVEVTNAGLGAAGCPWNGMNSYQDQTSSSHKKCTKAIIAG
ncbi:hypothetical protein Bca101_058163 [Brassica carinata]